jgi:hypothetical protein
MAESLEVYLQRLLQQAMEKQTPPTRPAPALVEEVEVVELVEIPAPPQNRLRPGDATLGREGAQPLESSLGSERSLSQLGPAPGDADAAAIAAPTIIDEIVSLLRSPGGAQKALVLSEILQRPQDRW